MKKNFLYQVLFCLLASFLISSCNEEERTSGSIENSNRREEIKKTIAFHSKGLEFFINQQKEKLEKERKFRRSPNLKLEASSIDVQDGMMNFLSQSNLTDGRGALGVISKDLLPQDYELLNVKDYNFKLSDAFYKKALAIVNVKGNSYTEINDNINNIIESGADELTPIEIDILLSGAETFLDSFRYWSKNTSDWEEVININHPNSLYARKPSRWNTLLSYAKADAKGAIAGGISGAIGGAVTGAIGGSAAGGVGAIPGAIAGAKIGALEGAIVGGVGNSILKALDAVKVEDEPKLTEEDIKIPENWESFALPKEVIEKIEKLNLKLEKKGITADVEIK